MQIEGLETFDSIAKMPLVDLPVRSVVATVDRGRVLISPGSRLSSDALRKMGAVTDIVAPNLFHTGGMKAAANAHPAARLWGPPGCREKQPGLRWHGVLGTDAWPHEESLSMVALEGMPGIAEHVFLHRHSRALLVSDLVFNVTDAEGFGPWLIFSLFGTHRKLGVSRMFLRFVKDRRAFEASVAKVAALDFDKLIPSHGAIVESGARGKLVAALGDRDVRV